MKKRIQLFLIIAIIINVAGLSQKSGSILKDTLSINEVVITGSRTYVNRNNVPLPVSVITREEIESSSESALLPVLSEQVPGFFVTRRGITGFGVATGAAGQITLRGIGGSPNTQVLVLLNGNPQFMGIMGHPLPDAYEASDVEKVEIIRGPASTLYGTNAMGGVINIITKEQKENGIKANARFTYGSYNTQKYMVNGGLKKNRFDVFISFNHDQTNGHRDSSEFRINNGYFRVGYDMNDHFNIKGDFSLANFKATDPGPEDYKAGYGYDITRGMGAAVLNNEFDKTSGSFRFFYNFGEHSITDGFHSMDLNYGIVFYQAMNLFKGNTFTIGVDLKKYGGMAENIYAMNGTGMTLGDTTVNESAIYAFIQQDILKRLIFNVGFRLEHNSVFGYEPVPSAGLAYNPSTSTTIKASVSKGFRSPTIRELYLFPPANENLKPERMMDYEISFIQRLLSNRLNLELTLFKAKGDNMILTAMGQEGPRNENTGSFSNTGVEFAGSFKISESFTINGNYSYLHMKEPVIAAPEQQFYLSGTFSQKRLSANISIQHIHNLYTRITPSNVKSNYTLLNMRWAYEINKYTGIFIKAENLTNKVYYINYGYPMPGIIFFAGLNLHL